MHPTYATADAALAATDEFYAVQDGFEYTDAQVVQWLQANVQLPSSGRVLDLCCGDGIWSKGIRVLNPELELFGIDISPGAIAKARRLVGADEKHFLIGDAEVELPFEDASFELIFARGPGLYNQHDMDRPATIRVIEAWHAALAADATFYSIFASNQDRMGTYSPMERVKLPYNRCPRSTPTVNFLGGKYHHTAESFLAPFRKAQNVKVVRYDFARNMHVLVTRRATHA